ncbi:Alcohol dehydrogenase [hydrothermal vent metagenome]|uniref:Alcohol dehydrogenase n=1 Tax=hydrothermal vent metagenome TaxID=652676 RepID=A0A1W1BDU8_9ZZZZ
MKRLQLLLFIIIALIFGACGTNIEDDRYSKTYDMWMYMTPTYTIDVEYDVYKNGQKIDYFIETTKLFPSGVVERVSGEDVTVLTPYDNYIEMDERDGDRVEVQRFVKIGDTNIFQSSSDLLCRIDDYFFEKTIRGSRFQEVIKISCQKGAIQSEIYYAYEEGIVSFYENNGRDITETVKVREIKLQ